MKVSALSPPVQESENFSYECVAFVPQSAGCYVLANASGDILYLGKATDLRGRMDNHLGDDEKRRATPFGVASVFHYALCEESQITPLENGWLNQFELAEGVLPFFNKKGASR